MCIRDSFKSEPGAWSWEDQLASPSATAEWDGVRNYQACNNMKAMRKGDKGFFYHSVNEKQIVGVVEIVKEYYPDPTDDSDRFGMVDVKAVKSLKSKVSLADIKSNEKLSNIALVRQARLSVMPIDSNSWKIICKMGGIKP